MEDLQRRVGIIEEQLREHGQKLEELGPIRTVVLARTIIASVRDAYVSDIKREALNNAAARQFDPRFGSQEGRKYWFDQASRLTDIEIKVLGLLRQHGELTADYRGTLSSSQGPSELDAADQIAVGAVLAQMEVERRPGPMLVERTPRSSHKLTASGYMLSGFISPIERRPDPSPSGLPQVTENKAD